MAMAGIYLSAGDSNSRLQACTSVLTKPSPQLKKDAFSEEEAIVTSLTMHPDLYVA